MLSSKNILQPPMFHGLLSGIYPSKCATCTSKLRSPEQFICLHCESDLFHDPQLLTKNNSVEQLFWGKVEIEFAGAVFNFIKGGKIQSIIHQFKYNGNHKLAQHMGKLAALNTYEKLHSLKIDALYAIPTSWKKKQKRGYNQAHELLVGFSSASGIPISKPLLKKKSISSQTDKSVLDRYLNIEASFIPTKHLNGCDKKHILIIDDVVTTGATLCACASIIKKHSNCTISILTLAYRNI